jgi:hypothetical protein
MGGWRCLQKWRHGHGSESEPRGGEYGASVRVYFFSIELWPPDVFPMFLGSKDFDKKYRREYNIEIATVRNFSTPSVQQYKMFYFFLTLILYFLERREYFLT